MHYNTTKNRTNENEAKINCDNHKDFQIPKWLKELERLRSYIRRSNKRNSLHVDPHSGKEMFVIHDDYIFERLYYREIKDKLSESQFEFYTLLKHGYTLKDISEIMEISYSTLRRHFKAIKKVVEKIFLT